MRLIPLPSHQVSWPGARWQGPSWKRPCRRKAHSQDQDPISVNQPSKCYGPSREEGETHNRTRDETRRITEFRQGAPAHLENFTRRTRARIDGLTSNTIGTFITGECKALISSLDHLDRSLLGILPPVGSQPPVVADLCHEIRNNMIDYVGRVRVRLKGQSSVRILCRC